MKKLLVGLFAVPALIGSAAYSDSVYSTYREATRNCIDGIVSPEYGRRSGQWTIVGYVCIPQGTQ